MLPSGRNAERNLGAVFTARATSLAAAVDEGCELEKFHQRVLPLAQEFAGYCKHRGYLKLGKPRCHTDEAVELGDELLSLLLREGTPETFEQRFPIRHLALLLLLRSGKTVVSSSALPTTKTLPYCESLTRAM